jgi:transglutaminase-like putative cysteine protease
MREDDMRGAFLPGSLTTLVAGLSLVSLGASHTFTNDTPGAVTGIRVVFSASVRIATYDKAVFLVQSPSSSSAEFSFTGGELQPGGRFKVSWADEEVVVLSCEWLGNSSSSSVPQYLTAFGIDYSHPDMYLTQGEQTRISNPAALDSLRGRSKGLAHLSEIYRWLRKFDTYSAGGATIGEATVDELLASRRLGGCHDFALVYAAVARDLGYPAVMVDTASVEWIARFQKGEEGPHVGHVFVEVFLVDRWVLIDSTRGAYVERGYDPANPVFREPAGGSSTGYYGMFKGIDTNAYGIHSNAELTQAMDALARGVDLGAVTYPTYAWKTFAQ